MGCFYFYAPVHFSKWDHRSLDSTGIGGSETCVVEMARHLSIRGHDVTVYAPLMDGCPEFDGTTACQQCHGRGVVEWNGYSDPDNWPDDSDDCGLCGGTGKLPMQSGSAHWLPLEAADFSQPGTWVLHRCPSALDNFAVDHPGQKTWLVCQDVFYPPKLADGLTPDRSAKLDWCLPLCTAQEKYLLEVSPELKGKLWKSSNGLRVDLIESITDVPARDPCKLIYTSSPDRGLIPLLKIFKRAKEFEPRLTLSAAYGFNNIDLCTGNHWKRVKAECERLMDQPGVTWLGRIPQPTLYREFLSAGIWCYPTTFTETSCCTAMESQALGAIPITNPLWALADNVRHGTFINGDAENDSLCRARYVGEILRLTRDQNLQEQIRGPMMEWARLKFSWARIADQWEAWAAGHIHCASPFAQYAFQLRHAKGKILNLGCNCDLSGFGLRGAVNVDLHQIDPFTKVPNKATVIADIRQPLPFATEFDTAILGDVLEHMTDADAVASLHNASATLKPGGRVVVTVPTDERGSGCSGHYANGVAAGHVRPITLKIVERWLGDAGMRVEQWQTIDYGNCKGLGVVACS